MEKLDLQIFKKKMVVFFIFYRQSTIVNFEIISFCKQLFQNYVIRLNNMNQKIVKQIVNKFLYFKKLGSIK